MHVFMHEVKKGGSCGLICCNLEHSSFMLRILCGFHNYIYCYQLLKTFITVVSIIVMTYTFWHLCCHHGYCWVCCFRCLSSSKCCLYSSFSSLLC